MSAPQIVPVLESEQQQALDTLVLAFAADPVERWLYAEAHRYLRHFPAFLAAFSGNAFAQKTVWRLGEFAGVALWLPPHFDLDGEAIAAVLTETVAPDSTRTRLQCSVRWTMPTPGFRAGISPGLALTRQCREEASAAN